MEENPSDVVFSAAHLQALPDLPAYQPANDNEAKP